jgi:Putative beta-barrel porin-2, OmpL-like. bbp2
MKASRGIVLVIVSLLPFGAAHAQGIETKPEPFAFADFSWVPGNWSPPERPLTFGPFTGELRVDTAYHYSFNQPADDTISGSSEVFRHGELQLTHLGLGGDFLYKNVIARVMLQLGMYSQATPRNDASTGRGQWSLDGAYRYVSEAYGGYHFDTLNGINVEAGIFMSYLGLWSYYNFDNWTYQPSYVSSNTPWYFQGVRVQIYTSDKLKIEPWLINGWQSYGRFNSALGGGGQVLWRPTGDWSIVSNIYYGKDTLNNPSRKRFHSDSSVSYRYFDDAPSAGLSQGAVSLTVDGGCESGGGVGCSSQYFLGFMIYNRLWFAQNRVGLTVGGGAITNPGRYLVLVPPINGATAFSGTPYFTYNAGDSYKAWDAQVTGDFSPVRYVTFRLEYNYRHANVPYFTGPGGITPPGGNQGPPGSVVGGWVPDLVNDESRVTFALLVRM